MSKFENLLVQLEDLLRVVERIDHDKKMMDEMLEELKVKIIQEMPTDSYSNSNVSLTKQKDYKLKIEQNLLAPDYIKEVPDRKLIKDSIKFGIFVEGVTSEEVIRLLIRNKNAEKNNT